MNILLETTLPCPICGTPVTHRHVRPRAFVEQSLDIDFYPGTIQWLIQGEHTNPRYCFMEHCPSCHFTANRKFFKEHDRITRLERFKTIFTNEMHTRTNTEITRLLAQPGSNQDPATALRLHLLGLRMLNFDPETAKKLSIELGKYYLRTAWIFRDISSNNKLEARYAPELTTLFDELTPLWPDVPSNENSALEKAAAHYNAAFEVAEAISTDEEEMRLLMLIARIHMKLGDLSEAHRIITSARDKQLKLEQKYKDTSRQGKLDEKTLGEMGANVRRMKKLLDDTKNIFEDLRGPWEAEQMQKGRNILAGHPGSTDEERRQILKEAGIDQRLVMRLVPVQKPKKKRGFFH